MRFQPCGCPPGERRYDLQNRCKRPNFKTGRSLVSRCRAAALAGRSRYAVGCRIRASRSSAICRKSFSISGARSAIARSFSAAWLIPEFPAEGTASHLTGYIHAEQQSRALSVPRPWRRWTEQRTKIADPGGHGRRTKNKTITIPAAVMSAYMSHHQYTAPYDGLRRITAAEAGAMTSHTRRKISASRSEAETRPLATTEPIRTEPSPGEKEPATALSGAGLPAFG
jgi:hypothetical protein